jgi:hypothetical protein
MARHFCCCQPQSLSRLAPWERATQAGRASAEIGLPEPRQQFLPVFPGLLSLSHFTIQCFIQVSLVTDSLISVRVTEEVNEPGISYTAPLFYLFLLPATVNLSLSAMAQCSPLDKTAATVQARSRLFTIPDERI